MYISVFTHAITKVTLKPFFPCPRPCHSLSLSLSPCLTQLSLRAEEQHQQSHIPGAIQRVLEIMLEII